MSDAALVEVPGGVAEGASERDRNVLLTVSRGVPVARVTDEFSLSRPRIYQIIKKFSKDPKALRAAAKEADARSRADARSEVAARIREAVDADASLLDVESVAVKLDSDPKYVAANIDSSTSRVLRDRRASGPTFTKEAIIAAMIAAKGDSPTLSEEKYRAYALGVDGLPSRSTILFHFRKWSLALEAAGIERRDGRGGGKKSRWSDEDLERILEDFVSEAGTEAAITRFNKFLEREHPEGPSYTLMRQRFGRWSDMKSDAAKRLESPKRKKRK